MGQLDLQAKLAILADAAKYDASCASSGGGKRTSKRRQGHRLERGHGDLPRLCARRPLHLAAQDPADQPLHLRLPLLHQPQELERPPRAVHPEEVVDLTLLLSAQLYRGAVPLFGDHPLARTTRWSSWSRSRGCCARTHDFAATFTSRRSRTPTPSWFGQAGLTADRVRSTSSCRPSGWPGSRPKAPARSDPRSAMSGI